MTEEVQPVEERDLREGAVALIDALGFRGIWGRHDPHEVLTFLKALKDRIEERVTIQFATQPWMQCQIAFLSDTIAVSMMLDSATPDREAMSVIYLCDVIGCILEETLRSKVNLAYRGAIAVGRYEISPHFLIGPAIDEAAGAHELAQGAFIWLTPAAYGHVARRLKG